MQFGGKPDKPADDADTGKHQQEVETSSTNVREEKKPDTLAEFMAQPFDTRKSTPEVEDPPSAEPRETAPQASSALSTPSQPRIPSEMAHQLFNEIMPSNAARQVIQHCSFGATGMMLRPGTYAVSNVPMLKIPAYEQLTFDDHHYLPWLIYQVDGSLGVVAIKDHLADAVAGKEKLRQTFMEAGHPVAKIEEIDAQPGELRLLASILREIPDDRDAFQNIWSAGEDRQRNASNLLVGMQRDLHIQAIRYEAAKGWRALRGRRGWQDVKSHYLKSALEQSFGTPSALRISMRQTQTYPFEDLTAGMESSAVEALHKTAGLAMGVCIIGGPDGSGMVTTAASVANFAASVQLCSACAVGIRVAGDMDVDWINAESIEEARETDAGVILWNTEMTKGTGRSLAKILEMGKLVIVSIFSASLVETIESLLHSGATTAFFTQSVSGIFQQIRVPLLCPDCSMPDDRDSTLADLGFVNGVTFNAKRRGSGFCSTCGGHHVLRDANLIEALIPSELDRNIKKSLFMDRNMIDADQAIIAKNRLWNSGLYHYVLRGEMDIDDLRRFAKRY